MAKTSVLSIHARGWGDGKTLADSPTPFTNANSPLETRGAYALANGDNALVVPAGAKSLMIENSTTILQLRGAAATQGWGPCPAGQPFVVPVTAAATVYLNSTGAGTADLTWL